jgi:hypothetical protein
LEQLTYVDSDYKFVHAANDLFPENSSPGARIVEKVCNIGPFIDGFLKFWAPLFIVILR